MKPKYLQFDCEETNKLDLRQANAVLKHKPDIIILEYPNNNETPDLAFNKYDALLKPKKLVKDFTEEFPAEVLKNAPWIKADTVMWKNLAGLWASGHQVFVYAVDAPKELVREWLGAWEEDYPKIKKNWLWWVQIYLRERTMANHVLWILNNYKEKENPKTLVFLQNFHWEHVKFLLKNPNQDEIWNYYFGQFPEINKTNIGSKIKNLNKIFYKYWQKLSDF